MKENLPLLVYLNYAMAYRFLLLQTHYRKPINFTTGKLDSAWKTLRRLYKAAVVTPDPPPDEFLAAIADDLNTPLALSILAKYRRNREGEKVYACLRFLGFLGPNRLSEKAAK